MGKRFRYLYKNDDHFLPYPEQGAYERLTVTVVARQILHVFVHIPIFFLCLNISKLWISYYFDDCGKSIMPVKS